MNWEEDTAELQNDLFKLMIWSEQCWIQFKIGKIESPKQLI